MSSFELTLSYQGQSVHLLNVTTDTTLKTLKDKTCVAFLLHDTNIQLLYKGKVLAQTPFPEVPALYGDEWLIVIGSIQLIKLNSLPLSGDG